MISSKSGPSEKFKGNAYVKSSHEEKSSKAV